MPIEEILAPGQPWPPQDKDHRDRLTRYRQNRKLFLGDHKEVYPYWAQKLAQEQQDFIELIINFPGMLSKLSADLLFGEWPGLTVPGKDEDSQEQRALARLVAANKLHQVNHKMAMGNSYRGDALYKIRFGKRTRYALRPEAILESVPPSVWFPISVPDNVQDIEAHVLAWVKEVGKKSFLRAEIHYPGRIENQGWLIDNGVLKDRLSWQAFQAIFPEYAEMAENTETGLDVPLIVHVPNLALDDQIYGVDDYMELDTLFQELNARMSQVSLVLNKHADPNMYGPDSALEIDPRTSQPRLRIGGKYFPTAPGEDPPGYVVWDGKLEAAFAMIDKLVEMIFYVSDTSPMLFGFEKSGGAQSGTALRLRLIRTLAKINRKRLYFDEGLKQALYLLQVVESRFGKPPESYTPTVPLIEWRDGLPQDALEQAQIEQIRTGNKPTTSQVSAIKRLDGLDERQAEEELDRIREDEEAGRILMPGIGQGMSGPGGKGEGGEA